MLVLATSRCFSTCLFEKKKNWMEKSTTRERNLDGCSNLAKVFCYANSGQMVGGRCERGHLQHVHLEHRWEGKAFVVTSLHTRPHCWRVKQAAHGGGSEATPTGSSEQRPTWVSLLDCCKKEDVAPGYQEEDKIEVLQMFSLSFGQQGSPKLVVKIQKVIDD